MTLTGTESQGCSQQPSGRRPTPLGPTHRPRGVPTPQGDHLAKFDWRTNLKDNTYKNDRLGEQVGPVEHTGRRAPPFRTTATWYIVYAAIVYCICSTLYMQPMKLLTRWLDVLPHSAGTFYMGGLANRKSAQYLKPVGSPASQHNHYDRAATQPTLPSVWDGESERVAETPSNAHDERSCVTHNRGDVESIRRRGRAYTRDHAEPGRYCGYTVTRQCSDRVKIICLLQRGIQ